MVYGELRQMAERSLGSERYETTSATSLVHDLFLQLMKGKRIQWEDRSHFFGIAARIMRQLLVMRARRRNTLKRGGGNPAPLPPVENAVFDAADLLALDMALEKLELLDPEKARLVELRFFGGLTMEETAEATGVSLATAKRHWDFSRRWLFREMSAGAPLP